MAIAIVAGCSIARTKSSAATPNGSPAKLNVIFILADDLGWADTTLYGHTKLYQTPNLERLAKCGMTFTRAYAASPLCSPTRSSIVTGLSPARTGITTPNCHLPQVVLQATPGTKAPAGQKSIAPVPVTRLNTTYRTLAESLKDAGYATGHFGKWHLGPEPYSPLQQGFDVDLPHTAGPGPAGSFVAPWKFKGFDADPSEPNQHIEDRMAKEAVAFMEKHKSEPFFLNYWMFSVHAPFDAKKTLIEKYRSRVDANDPQRSPTYAAMVESMDDAVGTLLDTIDRLGIAEHTMIVFFSDNGGNMYSEVDGTIPTRNAPLRGGKATVYEGGVRVPCIVSLPGTTAPGTRSDSVIQSSDFYPTILDTLGLHALPDQHFDGISIMPALQGKPLTREAIFTYFPHDPAVPDWLPPAVTVHCGDWKLIRIFYGGENGAHRWKLFHLSEDLGEKHDLASQEPARVKALDSLIESFLADTKAVTPVPNPSFNPAAYRPEEEGKQKPKTNPKQKSKPLTPASQPSQPKKSGSAAARDQGAPQLQGWKNRNCTATVENGIVSIKGEGPAPFLGIGGSGTGPGIVKLRARSGAGGEGKVEWLSTGQPQDPARSSRFTLPVGDLKDIEIAIPDVTPLGIVRIYVPAQQQPVEIDWIAVQTSGTKRRWDF